MTVSSTSSEASTVRIRSPNSITTKSISAPRPLGRSPQVSPRGSPSRSPTITHARPPTPIPLRPSAPLALHKHIKLPSISSTPNMPIQPSSLPSKPSAPMVQQQQTTLPLSLPTKRKFMHTRSRSEGQSKPVIDYATRALPPTPFVVGVKKTLPSPPPPQPISVPTTTTKAPPPVEDFSNGPSSTWFGFDDEEQEQELTITASPSELPCTPCSLTFAESDTSSILPSAKSKSIRWAEIAEFPEQQVLVNIHGLLRILTEAETLDTEMRKACEIFLRHLPQPGVESERRYALQVSQGERLEHALRILEGALSREVKPSAVDKARDTIQNLIPIVQLRFATIPYHRDVQRLQSQRAQVKEDRAFVLVQLAMQEAEIKHAQLRRETERRRELEEAAARKLKRKQEKLKEKEIYFGYRKMLEERCEELKTLNQLIEKESERLGHVREERKKKIQEYDEKVATKRILGGSLRIRRPEGIKCWI